MDLKKRCEDLAGSGDVSIAGPYMNLMPMELQKTREILPSAEKPQASLGGVCFIELFHLHY